MKADQVAVVGILIGLVALAGVLWGIPACAFETLHGGPVIFGADRYDKTIQHSGIQLIARSQARQAQPDGGSAGTGSISGNTANKSRTVSQQTPYSQCYNVCMAQCQTTPVPTTNCSSKCGQQCRPQAK
ncbi:MAG: hypothetical protein AB1473_20375 [Thermodesulfobacteriota bacterium]